MKKQSKKKYINKILTDLYSNYKLNTAFSSVKRLYNAARVFIPDISVNDVAEFLKTQDSYTLHKHTRKRFKSYRKILAARPKVIISLDLIDMSKLALHNENYKYLMFFIDVFSRKNTVIPILSKNQYDFFQGLKRFFAFDDNYKYVRLYSDYEGSLYSKLVQEFLNKNKILVYSNSSKERKNSLAEIGLKFLKRKIYQYMTHYSTDRYIDVLQHITSGINESNKRIFKNGLLTPQILHDIKNVDFLKEQFQKMYHINKISRQNKRHSFKINQLVRIPTSERTQSIFYKFHNIANTEEVFRIKKVNRDSLPFLYELEDLAGEVILGSFYGDELTPTKLKATYPVKILQSKIIKKRKMVYVTYLGWPAKFNEWLDSRKIIG